ncbi:MAG: hypothetical protein KC897_12565, partial [Candidatus Omnitrophica bacterium]|nr:hypothetical protein [Candidatus Omnitrophota bacterium]
NTLFSNGPIIFPYLVILFVQFLLLEILYFYPQWPLNQFFDPLVSKLESPMFMHYPLNLALLQKMYFQAYIPVYIFFSSFFVCVAIAAIKDINEDQKPNVRQIMVRMLPFYLYIIVTAVLIYAFSYLFSESFGMIESRADQIRSTAGPFFWLKQTILQGGPYFRLLLNVVAVTLFAYVFPLIAIERRNLFVALLENIKYVITAPIKTFMIVLLPTVVFAVVLLARKHVPFEGEFPEMRAIMIAFSILVMVIIDAVVYTSLTMFYLVRKGQ